MATIDRLTRKTANANLLAGFKQNWPANLPITLAGTVYQPADVVALIQSRVDAATAVEAANAAWRNAVKLEQELEARTQAEVAALRQFAFAMFAPSIAKLAEFGLRPRKARTVSPETNVLSAQKNRATREARHTMGKKERLTIKGALSTTGPGAT